MPRSRRAPARLQKIPVLADKVYKVMFVFPLEVFVHRFKPLGSSEETITPKCEHALPQARERSMTFRRYDSCESPQSGEGTVVPERGNAVSRRPIPTQTCQGHVRARALLYRKAPNKPGNKSRCYTREGTLRKVAT